MQKISETEIAKRAYAIWEGEGRPHGYDLDHWLRAERELEPGARPKVAAKPAPRRRTKRKQ